MWSFIAQSGLATGVMDFTNALSLLGVSLVGLVALSAGLIAFTALRQQVSQAPQPVAETTPAPADYRAAA
jgi:hypothetical protein